MQNTLNKYIIYSVDFDKPHLTNIFTLRHLPANMHVTTGICSGSISGPYKGYCFIKKLGNFGTVVLPDGMQIHIDLLRIKI